tara:strand:+ start:192 stop:398 length:207 start_codon:yes stop_codon:yes gene_type:complete
MEKKIPIHIVFIVPIKIGSILGRRSTAIFIVVTEACLQGAKLIEKHVILSVSKLIKIPMIKSKFREII